MTRNEIEKRAEEHRKDVHYVLRPSLREKQAFVDGAIEVSNAQLDEFRNKMMKFLEENPPNRAHTMIMLDKVLESLKIKP